MVPARAIRVNATENKKRRVKVVAEAVAPHLFPQLLSGKSCVAVEAFPLQNLVSNDYQASRPRISYLPSFAFQISVKISSIQRCRANFDLNVVACKPESCERLLRSALSFNIEHPTFNPQLSIFNVEKKSKPTHSTFRITSSRPADRTYRTFLRSISRSLKKSNVLPNPC